MLWDACGAVMRGVEQPANGCPHPQVSTTSPNEVSAKEPYGDTEDACEKWGDLRGGGGQQGGG